MQVSQVGWNGYYDPMDISEDVSDIEMDARDEVDEDEVDENENRLNRKRPLEESLRPSRYDAGNIPRKSRTQRQVHFEEPQPTYGDEPDAMAIERNYDLTKSARDQGWVKTTDEYEKFSIHPSASRNMPDNDFISFASQYLCFSKLAFSNGKAVTDFGFCRVLNGRSNLYVIDLSLCPNLTNATLYAIAKNCPFLRECSLLECPKVDDCGVVVLIKQCKDLRALSLDWCIGLTDTSLFAIAKYCPLLLELCLTEGTQFSLTALRTVLQGCSWLEKLDLWSCTQVTDAWVDTIIEWGHNLKELDLKYCDKVTPQGIARLKARFPNLNLTH